MAGPSLITLSLAIALGAYLGPFIQPLIREHLPFFFPATSPQNETCPPHRYTTQIISLDPPLIYIHPFVSPAEAEALIALGSPLLEPSPVTGYGSGAATSQARTSWSAPLPSADRTVSCVLARASSFLGTVLSPGRDDMGMAQMVRYTPGQKFDLHTDWFARPRVDEGDAEVGRRRMYNRVATLFVVLGANHTGGGETWFPQVRTVTDQARRGGESVWREHEDGGLAFPAVPGGGLFWMNLLANGTGDARTVHAGLPVEGGVKYALNIWPRAFFGPDA
ncbi:hypothetical protein QBC47DRAFT_447322 [Echria macrotheca]|uniref:Prolyl 4-hydroxylase alpha subunit domain-containing protein n=1 Tax=Echria macrotheca TaxID=438768 RepID=A0AAJ0B9X3_9PEZI|nr:hypothetical protein QBC47DRAFT_447322 [Echria macrotheca]